MKISAPTAGVLLLSTLLNLIVSHGVADVIDGPMGPWQDEDVGDTGAVGITTITNGVFTMSGSGEITGSADSFHYVYQQFSGDCAMVVRVESVEPTDPFARAGIMFRATPDPDSPHAFVFQRAGGRSGFQTRLDSGENTWTDGTWANAPYWVKLVRLGSMIVASDSPDGTNWNVIISTNVAMPETILVGLAMASHEYGTLSMAVLDSLQLASRPMAPSQVLALRAFDSTHISWADNSTNELGFRIELFVDWGTTNYWIGNRSVGPNVTNFMETYIPATYFRVQAIGLVDSAYSEIATARAGILDSIPPPWQSVDVGAPALPGGASFRGDEFRIVASGSGIGGTSDQFHFVYQQLYGDGEIMGQYPGHTLDFFASHDGKGGLMFRQSLEPDAPDILYYCGAGGSGRGYEVRSTAGADADTRTISNYLWVLWVRLTRSNNQFTLSIADDRLNWITITSQHIEMQDPVYVGMATSSSVNYYPQQSAFPQLRFAPRGGTIKAVALNNNKLALIVVGMVGRIYGIEASVNLRDWNRLTTQLNTNGTIAVTNTDAISYPRRFYRAILVQ